MTLLTEIQTPLWLILASAVGHWTVLGGYAARLAYRGMKGGRDGWADCPFFFACLTFLAWPVVLPLMLLHSFVSNEKE